MIEKTRKLCILAVLTALGFTLVPFFHIFGGAAAGKIFLPMHIPVLLAVFMLGFSGGLFMAVFLPVASFLFTGMPTLAVLPLMLTELCFYVIAVAVSKRFVKSVSVRLLISLIAGRLAYAAVLCALFYALGIGVPAPLSVAASLLTSLPGILIQLLLLPPVVNLTQRLGYTKNGLRAFKKISASE